MANLKYIGKNILNHDLTLKKGNVSGSATSTGSFGELEVVSNIQIGSATLFSNSDDLRFDKNFGIGINPDSNLNGTFLHIYDGGNAHLKLEVAGPYNTGMHLNNSTAMTTFYNTYANATNYGGFRWNAGGGEGADGGGTELMRLRGSRLGIMNPNPPKTLSVSGDISGSGTLEILGNITGSGNLEIAGNISGSSTSTGSFGIARARKFQVNYLSSGGTLSNVIAPYSAYINDATSHTTHTAAGNAPFNGLSIENANTTNDAHASVGFRVATFDSGISAVYGGSTNVGKLAFTMEGNETFVINTSNQISGSAVSTGSFGKVEAGIFSGSFHGQIGARYLHEQSTASTTWTMIHNLGSKYPNVTVYDSNDEIIIPASITATTSNETTLTFSSAVAGVAQMGLGGGTTVSGRTFLFEQGTASTLWAVTHSLGEQFPAVTIYDADNRVLIPAEIQAIDLNHMEVTFQNATSGNGHFSVGNGLPGVNADNAGNFMRVSAGGTHIEYTNTNNNVTGSFLVTGSIEILGSGSVSGSSTSTGSFGELHIADKIGIGTTNPDNSSLHVAGHINLDDDKAVAWGGGSSRPAIIGNTSNNTLKFYTNGSERISVASSGEIGIGIASPDNTLHVHKGTAGSVAGNNSTTPLVVENNNHNFIQFLNPADKQAGLYFGSPSNNYYDGTIAYDKPNEQFAFEIDAASGNNKVLQVGTTYISSSADVTGSFGKVSIGGTGFGLAFHEDPDTGIRYGGTNTFEIHTGGSKAIEVNGSQNVLIPNGKVGIGTGSPSRALHVAGDALVTGILTAQEFHTEFVSASVMFESGSTKFGDTSDDRHEFTGSLNVSQSVHYIGGQLYIDKPSDPLVQVSDGTRTMLAGYITSTGGLVGTTSNHPLEIRTNNTARINITNGGNVSFPTANAKISGSATSTGSFGTLTVNNHAGGTPILSAVQTAQHGAVGIGTATPYSAYYPVLNLYGAQPMILLQDSGAATTDFLAIVHDANNTNIWGYMDSTAEINLGRAINIGGTGYKSMLNISMVSGSVSGSSNSTGSFGQLRTGPQIITNNVTNNTALTIDNNTEGYAIDIDAKFGPNITQDSADGRGLEVSRNNNDAESHPLVSFTSNHTAATQPTLKIQQDGAGYGIEIDQNGNANAIRIDGSATNNVAGIQAHCDSLTTGRIAYFYSNSSDNSTRGLVKIVNDHASATGATALEIQQDAAQRGMLIEQNGAASALKIDQNANDYALEIVTDATSGQGINVNASSLQASGMAARFYSNSSNSGTRKLIDITNDHASATGTTLLNLQQDSTGDGIHYAGGGHAISGSSTSTGSFGMLNATKRAAVGASLASAEATLVVHNATGAESGIKIEQDQGQYGLEIDQDGNNAALYIDSEATTNSSIYIPTPANTAGSVLVVDGANSLTTGRILYLGSNSSDTNTRNLVEIVNDHASATGATALKIQQDSTGLALDVDGTVDISAPATDTVSLTIGGAVESSAGLSTHGASATIINKRNEADQHGLVVGAKNSSSFPLIVGRHDSTFSDLVVDGSGKVGIGVTSPEAIGLHIQLASSDTAIDLDDKGHHHLVLQNNNTATSNGRHVGINMQVNAGGGQAAADSSIYTEYEEDGGAKLHFTTTKLGTGQERMVIDSDGLVGIGTTSPSSQLNVVRSGTVSDNDTVVLADISFTKTGGDADQSTLITGLKSSAIHNDANSGFGNLTGGEFNATNTQNKNAAGNGDNIMGISANTSHVAGIVNTVTGVNNYINVDAGGVDQYVAGSNITVDIESAVNITGDVYGQKIYMDVDDTNAAQVWGLEIEDGGSGNWDGGINTSLSDGYAISGSARSTGSFGKVYADTYVERPNSPAFQIASNATSENTDLALATTTFVTMSREVFDNGGNVADSTFTAPVTGKYQFNFTTKALNIDSAGTYIAFYLFTSNRTYTSQYAPAQLFSADAAYHTFHMQAVADMDANDTAYIGVRPQGGTQQMDLEGDSSASPTHFSGFLI